MRLVLLTLIVFTTFTAWSKSCHIDVYSKVYTLDKNISKLTKEIIKKSDCSQNVKLDFVRFLTTTNGVVSNTQLARMFKSLENKDVKITPSKISIRKLDDYLTDRIAFSKNWFVRDINSAMRKSSIVLNDQENIHVDCPSCSFPGNKSIRLIIQNPINNTNKFQMLNAKVLIKTIALVPRGMIQVNNLPLSENMFKKKAVFVDNPAHIFLNKKALVFYKVNNAFY